MLVHNWRVVLRRARSVRLMALALFFIVLESVTNFVTATRVSRNLYIQLAMSATSGSRRRRSSQVDSKSQEN